MELLNDPNFAKYLETHSDATYDDYLRHCGEEYNAMIERGIKKNLERNESLVEKYGQETFVWAQKFMQKLPDRMSRKEMGDTAFDATLRIMAKYNGLMLHLSKEEIDEKYIESELKKLAEWREKIENNESHPQN